MADPFAGQTVDADWGYYLDAPGTYTPALTATTTNPNLGADGSISGWYHRSGLWIAGSVLIHFSGSGLSGGSGTYEISLPLDADTSIMTANTVSGGGDVLGGGFIRDNNATGNSAIVQAQLRSASLVRLKLTGGITSVTSSNPFPSWEADDRISFAFGFIADPAGLPT